MRIVEKLQATVYRVLLSASAVDQDVRNDADDAVKATVTLLEQAEAALEKDRDEMEAFRTTVNSCQSIVRKDGENYWPLPDAAIVKLRSQVAKVDALLAKLHEGGE